MADDARRDGSEAAEEAGDADVDVPQEPQARGRRHRCPHGLHDEPEVMAPGAREPMRAPAGALSRNPWSIGGAVVTTVAAVAFITFASLEAFGLIVGPYANLLGYLLVPAVFVAGLLLIPFGMWREGVRRRRGAPAWSWPAVDLGRRRTRQIVAVVLLLTIVNLGIVAVASVGAVQYTESTKFC